MPNGNHCLGVRARVAKKMIPPARTIEGPGGIGKNPVASMPPIDAKAPNDAAIKTYLEILVLTFLAAAAGIMTREPISRVPATFNPRATTNDIRIIKMRFVLFTEMFIDLAISLESIPIISPRLIREVVMIIVATAMTVINRSDEFTEDTSPNKASSSSGSGVRRSPTAKLRVKNIPTKVSDGNSVFLSNIQTPTVAKNKAVNAPKKGLRFQINAKAIPGRATCDKASPTRDILFKTINEPRYPAPIPIKAATASCRYKSFIKSLISNLRISNL
ncbi:MAG: hypothetical protein A2918_01790 [Candidatus Yanofskybacteria bacterium RIFCSPLOWO2_01_FULL_42_49]|uniref:Uncharacterized protein n=1 Tax=Candidatus Yanofskybacteria bacterium RIFCSPLOWO2_01_FULL_42_49 TaxID=1802694 RepID=A0A1F8GAR7_9BACT|nr:MAG: hypothetical protein A2918_01790 [Candidatus Yanofskybacteria bacterium RIFCSPLOWO2_01_FULL_42_49]